ncbi:MAG: acylneuraminate cytidylyltransferase [Verrucomicrobiota bacterium]
MRVAIIPARGGSKGIPCKNLQIICGKPLLWWNIQAALKAKQLDSVFVSTDDPEIGHVAKDSGAEVIWRPDDLASDDASSEAALIHGLLRIAELKSEYCISDAKFQSSKLTNQHLKTKITSSFQNDDILVFLQCTSPLTVPEDIDGLVTKLISQNVDSILSVTASHQFLWQENKSNTEGINHDKRLRHRRQNMRQQFAENGAIYAMRIPGFLKAGHRFFGKTALYEMSAERSWEIDEPLDLEIGEILLRKQLRHMKRSLLPKHVTAVVFDFDGVLTDNKVYQCQDSGESVMCSRSDGMGIRHLLESGIKVLILSSEENPVVAIRAKKLKVEVIYGSLNKAPLLDLWVKKHAINLKSVVYVGNDVNDIEAMRLAGCPVAVADAHSDTKRHALIVTEQQGGYGAAREVSDLILSQRYG